MSSWDELKKQIEELLAEHGELPAANPGVDGLMSCDDYAKLKEVAEKANKIAIDDVLADSVNPVQNKVVTSRLDGLNSSLVSLDASITEAADSKGNPNTYNGLLKLTNQLTLNITTFENCTSWIRGDMCGYRSMGEIQEFWNNGVLPDEYYRSEPHFPPCKISVNCEFFCGNQNIILGTQLIENYSTMVTPMYMDWHTTMDNYGELLIGAGYENTSGTTTNEGIMGECSCFCWPNFCDYDYELYIGSDGNNWNVNTDAWSVYWDVDERTNLFQELQSAISSLNQNNHQSVRNTVESLLHEIYLYFVRLELFLNTTIASSSDPECAEFFTQKELFNTAKSELQEVAKAFGVYNQWWEEEPINPPVMSINTTREGGEETRLAHSFCEGVMI